MKDRQQPRRAIAEPTIKRRRSGKTWIFVVVAVAVLLGGGGVAAYFSGALDSLFHKMDLPIVSPIASHQPSKKLTEWPLTGVSGTIESRATVVAEVENSETTRPLIGLEVADFVMEEAAGPQVTRLSAVFNSVLPLEVSSIGSLPSTPDQRWPESFVVLSSGQSPSVQNTGETPEPLAQFDVDGQGSTSQRYGEMTTAVSISLPGETSITWVWDADSFTWLRTDGMEPTMTGAGTQVAAVNLIIVEVDCFPPVAGTDIPTNILIGEGKGLVASGQMSAPITWKRDSLASLWEFTAPDGTPLALVPGNTWIEIVPKSLGDWTPFT